MTGTKCTLKRLFMCSVWLYKFVTVYIRIQNYFNKVSGCMYRHNFNSVSEGLFWVYYHTSLCFWHAVQLGVYGIMFWRCRIYSWLQRAVVTFRCQPVTLRGTLLSACDASYCDTYVTTFRRNLLPPPSEWKCKQREERRPMLFGFLVTCFTVFTSRYVIFLLSFYLWSLLKATGFQ